MDTQAIMKQYDGLRRAMPEADLPALASGVYQLKVASEVVNSAEDAYAALDRLNPVAGWLGYQSGNQHFDNEPLPSTRPDYGQLLNAEVTDTKASAVHVRYNGNGGWIVTTYHYSAGSEYLADKVQHIASFDKDSGTTLQYLRFWKEKDGALGVNPVFACFVGFGGKL